MVPSIDGVILEHVIVVSLVVFSGHVPQFVSMWYCKKGHVLATGPQLNVIKF